MLHRDYLLEVIQQFVNAVSKSLARAILQRDFDATQDVESAIAELMQLDPNTAMALSPESLVTMMMLSGTGDAVAGYAAYALNKLADAYDLMGQPDVAQVRREQAVAVADAFGADVNEVPEELLLLDAELRA